eukprot:3141653-Alexandrium_andersonii.AAC.1
MSASLVGSEMCIRDSLPRLRLRPVLRHLAESSARRAHPGPGRNPSAGGPVSYTHLTLPTICSV